MVTGMVTLQIETMAIIADATAADGVTEKV